MTPLDIARDYIRRGWAPVPIPFRAKRPALNGWEHLRIDIEAAAKYWNGVSSNFGIILGDASHGLADVDLDCAEAVELAPRILPATASFGRATNPNSHWEYYATGAATKQFKDDKRQMLVELRATAEKTGNGQQSVFPGSTHKDTGEQIEWTQGTLQEPLTIPAEELKRLVARLATACVLRRIHPELLEDFLAGKISSLPPEVATLVNDWSGVKPERAHRVPVASTRALVDYGRARERFNLDHPLDATNRGSACPAEGCEGKNSFKGDSLRATCFHSSHPDGCGTRCGECVVFDPLDLEAHNAGWDAPTEYLIDRGFWTRPTREEPPPPSDADMPQWSEPTRIPGEDDVAPEERFIGWNQPVDREGRPAGLPTPRNGPRTDSEITRAIEDLRRRHGATRTQRLEFTNWADLRHKEFSKPVWMIRGILPHQAVAATGGEPKSNKTWVLIEAAVAMATATPMFKEFLVPERQAVALVLTEDDEQNVRNRIRSLLAGRGLAPDAADGWLFTIARAELSLLNETSVADLIAACRRLPRAIGLLGLDPLRNLHDGDENDSTEMIGVMAQLRAVRDVLGCAVAFNHHTVKASKDTEGRRPGQKMRGSSAIHGAVDAGFYMSDSDTDGRTTWTNKVDVEIKGARGAGHFEIRLDVKDDENDEACLAEWCVEGLGAEGAAAKEAERAAEERSRKEFLAAEKAMRADKDHEELVARIVSALTTEPASTGTVRGRVRASFQRVVEGLETAKTRGLAAQRFDKKRPLGWVRVDNDSPGDPNRPKPTQIEPEKFGSVTHTNSALLPLGRARECGSPMSIDANSKLPNRPVGQKSGVLTPEERARLLAMPDEPIPDRPPAYVAARLDADHEPARSTPSMQQQILDAPDLPTTEQEDRP